MSSAGNMYRSMLETAESAGLKVLSDDFCAQLLAWLYIYGGGSEAVTYNMKLREDIFASQRRFNIYGSEKPKDGATRLISRYVHECEALIPNKEFPHWVYNIGERYGFNAATI